MSYHIKIGLFSFMLLTLVVHNCFLNTSATKREAVLTPVEPAPTITVSDKNVFKENSEITRNVLITHCGRCHQSSLETHKKAAIAVFDLDMDADWHLSLLEHNLEGIANRTRNSDKISDDQKSAIAIFLENKAAQLKH